MKGINKKIKLNGSAVTNAKIGQTTTQTIGRSSLGHAKEKDVVQTAGPPNNERSDAWDGKKSPRQLVQDKVNGAPDRSRLASVSVSVSALRTDQECTNSPLLTNCSSKTSMCAHELFI